MRRRHSNERLHWSESRQREDTVHTMAKYVSPAQQRQREIDRLAAQARPVVKTALDTLLASWTEMPADHNNQFYAAIRAAVDAWNVAGSADARTLDSIRTELANQFSPDWQRRWRREQLAREQAAAALVDTHRPVVATVAGYRAIGEPVILRALNTQTQRMAERVLICIGSGQRARDFEANEDGGVYSDLAEPTEAERQAEPFQRLQAQIDARRAEAERQTQMAQAARQAELDAIRANGRELSLFDDLFAGSSDD